MAGEVEKKEEDPAPKQDSVEALMKRGSYDQAAEILRKRLGLKHSDEDTRLLAECLAEGKDYQGALEAMSSLTTKAPRDVFYEGLLYFDAETIDKARERFGEYIALRARK